jgi:non-ribosomal peptide synthetase component F
MTALSFTEAAFASASPADRAFFLQHCMGPSESVPFNLVHNAFEHHARATPHATAVEHTSENESITYADLDRRANRLAHRLRGHGIGPNQRVCILARRSIVNVIAIIAVLKAGGQYVPLDGDTITDVNLDYVLSDSATPLVLCMEEYLHRVSAAPAVVLEATINADERCGADCSKPTELATTADGCYVIYTSGTTGKPKGVDVKHSGVVNCAYRADQDRAVS